MTDPVAAMIRLQAERERRDAAKRTSTSLMLNTTSPEAMAEGLKIGGELGLPASVIAQDPEPFRRQAEQRRNALSLQDAPGTQRFLNDPVAAAIAKDDVETLSGLERAIRLTGDTVWGEAADSQFGRGVGTGVTGVQQMGTALKTVPVSGMLQHDLDLLSALSRVRDMDAATARHEIASELGISPMSQAAAVAYDFLRSDEEGRAAHVERILARVTSNKEAMTALVDAVNAYSEDFEKTRGRVPNFTDIEDARGFADWFAFTTGQGLPYLAIAALGGALGGAPGLFGAGYGMGVGDIQAGLIEQEIEDQGGVALAGAVPYAGLELLGPAARPFRGVGTDALKQVATGYFARLGREVPENAVEEFINEAGQEIIKDYAIEAGGGEEVVLNDETLLRWFNSGMAGAATGAALSPLSAAEGNRRDMQRAQEAGATMDRLQRIDDLVAASKVRERSPEKFRDFTDSIGMGDRDIMVPAEDMREYFQAKDFAMEEILEALEIDPEVFAEIEAAGGDVPISESVYASRISGSEHAEWFKSKAVTQADEMNYADAQRFNEEVQEIMRAAREEADAARMADLEARASDQQVFDRVYSDLRAVGRSPDVAQNEARVWSAFWRTMGERYGEDPLELARWMGVDFRRPEQDAARRRNEMDIRLNTLRSSGDKALAPSGMSLTEFVIQQGGVRDAGGDVEALEGPRGLVAETAAEVRERTSQATLAGLPAEGRGKGLHELGRAAVEAGYFPGADAQDAAGLLLDALREEVAGRPTYVPGEGPDPEMQRLSDALAEAGVDLSSVDNDAAIAALEGRELRQQVPITETPEFRNWFGDSKVVDESGAPLVVYHGSDARDIEAFETGRASKRYTTFTEQDIESQAIFFSPSETDARSYGRNVTPAYLSVKKPLEHPQNFPASSRDRPEVKAEIAKRWEDFEYIFAPAIDENGMINVNNGMSTVPVRENGYWMDDVMDRDNRVDWYHMDNPEIVARMKERGYDGVRVHEENDESGFSWAAFSPEQIKSVSNRGTFDPNDPRILYQGAVPDPEQSVRDYQTGFAPNGPNFTDLSGSAGALFKAIRKAKTKQEAYLAADDWVLKRGRETGVEHLAAFDREGGLIAVGSGLKAAVGFPEYLLSQLERGLVEYGTHNHPSNGGFSVADLSMSLAYGMDVTAMGHKGAIVSGSWGPKIAEVRSPADVGKIMADVDGAVRAYLQGLIDSETITIDAAVAGHAHAVDLVRHRYGLLDLRSNGIETVEAGNIDIEALYDAVDERVRNVFEGNKLSVDTLRDFDRNRAPGGIAQPASAGRGATGVSPRDQGAEERAGNPLPRNDPRQLRLLEGQAEGEPPLFVPHNLSAENLRHVLDLGGMAAPSLAIARGEVSGVPLATRLSEAFRMAQEKQYRTGRELKEDLQAASLAAQREAGIDLTTLDEANIDRLADFVVEDAIEALQDNANAIGWYDRTVTAALEEMARLHPEILTDSSRRLQFTWALAVTSNGLKVDKNFEVAEKAYEALKASNDQRFPKKIGIGTAAVQIDAGLAMYGKMLDRFDGDHKSLADFMNSEVTVRDLEAEYGLIISGEGKGEKVRGASILGPKIGNGFFANLYGNFDALTMDRWLMRSVGRWRGTLININQKMIAQKRSEIRDLIGGMSDVDRKAIRKLYGGQAKITARMTQADIDMLAAQTAKLSMKPDWRAKLNAASSDMRKLGNGLAKYLDGQVEHPAGARERAFIREVFRRGLARLQESEEVQGISHQELTMSDLQALLWYPEKRLYDTAKQTDGESRGYADEEAPDYANAARNLVRRRLGSDGRDGRPGGRPADDGRGVAAGSDVTGRGRGYASGGLAPLEGAPTVRGASGPDPRLVAVAERYASENGIELRRQGEFVEVDEDRAARIAKAYEDMAHSPQDAEVKAAYRDLIDQTKAQYQALIDGGYQFFFFDETNDPYEGNPWNAMRDLRANQTMAVYTTEGGFGTDAAFDPAENPMLEDTGIEWGWGRVDGEPRKVLANDLFRAVHDAFGHGLEGAGFRARGEENAWQAHVRLFTGPAVAAITTETRGQNSWLNYGPHGEKNRTASVEETVFADQKTGIMPEWTWTEGRAPDEGREMFQKNRGSIQLPTGGVADGQSIINLFEGADLSTVLHESGHFFLEAFTALASQPNAPDAMREDLNAIREFLGAKEGEQFTRDMHEKWARGFEAYLMEGQAPSLALADAFARFKAWLTRIYRSIAGLNVKLTPEVREVMDRMLATDAEIAEARSAQAMDPLFSEKPPGMSASDWATYQRMARRSEEQASQRLLKKTMEKIRREKQAWWKEEKAEVEAQVAREINGQPVYRLVEMMANGRWIGNDDAEVPDIRISRFDLIEQFGEGVLPEIGKDRLGGKRAIYTTGKDEAGMSPQEAAEFFGFENAGRMIEALQNAPRRKDAIAQEVDRRMLERHGDALNDGSIEEEALAAIHSEQQAMTTAAEARHIARQLGRDTRNMQQRVYKQRARLMIGRMSVKQASQPSQFLAAERRAARRAQEAFAKVSRGTGGREALAEALQAKEQQILNGMLFDEARRFEKEIAKRREKMRAFGKKDVRAKIGEPYIDQIDAILEGYDFRQRAPGQIARTESLKDFVDRMIAEGREADLNIDSRLMDEANRTHYSKMSVDEARGLFDTIDNLEHMGRFKNQLLDRKRKRDLMKVVKAVEKNVLKAPLKDPEKKYYGLQALNLLRRPDTILVSLDRGEEMGPVYEAIKRPIDEGQSEEQRMSVAMAQRMDDLFRRFYTPKQLRDMQVQRQITDGRQWSKAEIISIALNTGAESNFQRLMDPNVSKDSLMSLEKLDVLLGNLDQKDWEFVQAIWDEIDTYWPQLAEVHKRRTGVTPKKVDPKLMVNAPSFVRGGYYPIKYDPTRGKAAAQDEATAWDRYTTAGHGTTTQVANGMTKQREKSGGGRTLLFDLSVPMAHMRDTIRYIALSEAVDNAHKVLNHPRVFEALQQTGNAETLKTLNLWLQDTAQGPMFNTDLLNSTARMLKNNFTLSRLAFNMKTVFLQVTGLGQSAATIGKRNMVRGMMAYARHPAQMIADVTTRSAFMAERQTTFQKDIRDFMNEASLEGPLQGRYRQAKTALAKAGFWPIIKTQFLIVDMPTWLGAYDAGLRQFDGDEERAVAYADRMVARAQDSGLFGDRAGIERGTLNRNTRQSDFVRLWTTLGGYMLTKLNRAQVSTIQAREAWRAGDATQKAATALNYSTDMMLLMAFEAAVMGLIYALMTDEEDDEDLAKFMLAETGTALVGGIPFLRDASSGFRGFDTGGILGSTLGMPGKLTTQVLQGENDRALRRAIGDTVGVLTGLPTTATIRLLEGILEPDQTSPAEALFGSNPLTR